MSMKSVDRTSSVTVRLPNSLLDILDTMVEEKKYPNRSEAIRTLVQDGTYLAKIIKLAKDPKKSKELTKTLSQLDTIKDVKETLATMEPHQLLLVQSLAKDIRDEKVKQTILDMKE